MVKILNLLFVFFLFQHNCEAPVVQVVVNRVDKKSFWRKYNPEEFVDLLIESGSNETYLILKRPPKRWYKEKYIKILEEKYRENLPCASVISQTGREFGLMTKESKGAIFEVQNLIQGIKRKHYPTGRE